MKIADSLYFFMRYHNDVPKEWTNYYGSVYRCNHPVYRVSTLYFEHGKGLCVIQQRFNEKSKTTVTVRQIMWALRMKPLKKERWETVFDRSLI